MNDKGKPPASKVDHQLFSHSSEDDYIDINWDQPPPSDAILHGDSGDVLATITSNLYFPSQEKPVPTDLYRDTDDGRLDICINAKAANSALLPPISPDNTASQEALAAHYSTCPPLNIVIQIVGSRGILTGARRTSSQLYAYSPQAMSSLSLRWGKNSRLLVTASA